MIDFYTYNTINGQAVAIALQLLQLPHATHLIDLTRGEQRRKAFLTINPSGRIPVIVDEVHGEQLVLSQTGAILLYLADKTKHLLSTDVYTRAKTVQWMQFVLTDISTNVFNNFHLKSLVSPKQPAAGEFMKQRAIDFCDEIEQQLNQNHYLIGEQISLADVVAFPVLAQLNHAVLNAAKPNITRWFNELADLAAFQKGMNVADN